MPRVAITLEDVDGAVQANIVFEGDFDTQSNAHQVAQLLLRHMDTLMDKYSETNTARDVVEIEGVAV